MVRLGFMSERPLKVLSPIERKDGKTFWARLGSAWKKEKNGKLWISVVLDGLPVNGKLAITEDDGERKGGGGGGGGGRSEAPPADDDSGIPF